MNLQTTILLGAFLTVLFIIYLNTFIFDKKFLMSEPEKDKLTLLTEKLSGDMGGVKYVISDNHGILSFKNFLDYLTAEDPKFRNLLIKILKEFPSEAYFWECKPATKSALELTSFEFVIIPSTELVGVTPSHSDFKDKFNGCETTRVTTFPNLGKDALLIAPCPGIIVQDKDSGKMIDDYAAGHLASFVRHAPDDLLHLLFKTVGISLIAKFDSLDKDHKKLWLSTSGLGVPWVHIRLDTSPKYYTWEPYANTLFG